MANPAKVNSNTGLAFILGAICVVIAGVGYAIFEDDDRGLVPGEGERTTLEKAADAISGG